MENLNRYVNELVWHLEHQRQVEKAERERMLAEYKQAQGQARKAFKQKKSANCEPVVVKEKLGWN